MLLHWLARLAPGGVAWFVVGKNLGGDSLQRWLNDQGYPCERHGECEGVPGPAGLQRTRAQRRPEGMEAALAAAEAEAGAIDFEVWVTEKADALLRFAYVLTGDVTLAEDAVQDALTTACARWARVSRADDPEAYVKRMVVNAHISWWRRFRRREAPTAEPVRSDVGPHPTAAPPVPTQRPSGSSARRSRTGSAPQWSCASTKTSRTPRSAYC